MASQQRHQGAVRQGQTSRPAVESHQGQANPGAAARNNQVGQVQVRTARSPQITYTADELAAAQGLVASSQTERLFLGPGPFEQALANLSRHHTQSQWYVVDAPVAATDIVHLPPPPSQAKPPTAAAYNTGLSASVNAYTAAASAPGRGQWQQQGQGQGPPQGSQQSRPPAPFRYSCYMCEYISQRVGVVVNHLERKHGVDRYQIDRRRIETSAVQMRQT